MKKKQLSPWLMGILAAVALVLGICLLFVPKPVIVVAGIVLICLSIAFGLITINPVFALGIVGGVLMIFLPPWTAGIFLMICGIGGMIGNVAANRKK